MKQNSFKKESSDQLKEVNEKTKKNDHISKQRYILTFMERSR